MQKASGRARTVVSKGPMWIQILYRVTTSLPPVRRGRAHRDRQTIALLDSELSITGV
jgi:hypothetical protein